MCTSNITPSFFIPKVDIMFQAIPSRSTLIYCWIWIVIHWNWIFETTFCFLFSTLHSRIEVLWPIGLLRWSLRMLSSTTYWNRKINFLFWSFKKFENIIDNFFVMKHWFYGSLGLNTLNRKQNSFQFHFRICLHLLFDKKKVNCILAGVFFWPFTLHLHLFFSHVWLKYSMQVRKCLHTRTYTDTQVQTIQINSSWVYFLWEETR